MAVDPQKMLGASIKASRNLLGISQEALAERAELHRTYISDLECGTRNPSLQTIVRLAKALEVSISTLFPQDVDRRTQAGGHRGLVDTNLLELLLVEDNADDVELTLHSIKQTPLANRIQVVRDGKEALDYLFCEEKYAQRRPDDGPLLVLLDLTLPRLNGIEVLRRIKADERTKSTPVVILSASNARSDIEECRSLGAAAFINKPLTWLGFGRAIRRLELGWGLMPLRDTHSLERPN